MTNPFTTSPQFERGMSVAAFLDQYFAPFFEIEVTTPYQERTLCLGDRIYRRRDERYYVEYKSGLQTHYTGNIFLETISVDNPCRPGWVYTCQAHFILYAALLDGLILVFRPDQLRRQIADLRNRFPEKATSQGQNAGYHTHGVVVPLAYATSLAAKVVEMKGKQNFVGSLFDS